MHLVIGVSQLPDLSFFLSFFRFEAEVLSCGGADRFLSSVYDTQDILVGTEAHASLVGENA